MLNPSNDTHSTDMGISEFIDQQPLGKQQYTILILCGILMVLDGFDVQSVSYVAPAILDSWQIQKSQLGGVFGSGLFGLLIGSLIFSLLSDKLGRRPILLASTLFFALCMLATALVQNVEQLIILRFITGLGLGAIMPNAMALCGEISPKHKRVSIMMIISCGFTVGAMIGGLIAAYLIPRFGWQSVFIIGGILPLMIFALLFKYMPESLQFLALKDSNNPKIHHYLTKFYPNTDIPIFRQPEAQNQSMPVKALFEAGRHKFTISIWIISMLNMISLYFLSSWMPTLAKDTGMDLQKAVLLGATLQLGGTLGTILMGKIIDKQGFHKVLIPCFVIAALSIALLGHSTNSVMLFFVMVFVVGFMVIGGQPAINAMAADYYPTQYRTTGVGWSLGVGRIGSVVGPMIGGLLMQGGHLSSQQLFYFVAIPSIAILAMLFVQKFIGVLHPRL